MCKEFMGLPKQSFVSNHSHSFVNIVAKLRPSRQLYQFICLSLCLSLCLSTVFPLISNTIHQSEAKKAQTKKRSAKSSSRQSSPRKKKRRKSSRRKKRSTKKKKRLKDEPALSLSSLDRAFQRALNKKALRNAKVGYTLRRLDNGKTLLAHQADTLFHPASNTKIVTTAAAYKVLGPSERFVTRWYIEQEKKENRIISRLYWRASGDPKLVPENFKEVAESIKRSLNEKKLALKVDELIIDDQGFTQEFLAPGYDQKPDDDASYRAANGSVGFQFNRFTTAFKPNKKVGEAPLIIVTPDIPYFKIQNQAKTSRKGKERLRLVAKDNEDLSHMVLDIGGTIPRRHKSVSTRRRIGNPIQFAGQSFLHYLRQAGVKVEMNISRGLVPSHLQPIKVHKSPLMSSLIKDINVYSNNYMAEQLLLAMGMRVRGFAGWTEGQLVVRSYLDAIVGIQGYKYVNGSGLFGETAFSPNMLTEVLIKAYQESRGAFRELLPMAGKEGTLRKRLRQLPKGAFHGKTGTLDHVSTLCGYLNTREAEKLVLCLMMNDFEVKTWAIRSVQDELVNFAWLLRSQSSTRNQ